jgi:2-polyprenyl-6-methoxyphenol hydroxylase-like FAD-dependent oxidoreductase
LRVDRDPVEATGMADVIVLGGGMCGMVTAMLLAKDGNTVTVLERDPMGPPGGVEEAWTEWQRRGVGQFRLLHYLQPRFRQEIEAALPELVAEMDALGAIRHQSTAVLPAEYTGGVRPDDERFTALTGRRPMLETAVGQAAAHTPGLTVRRGVAVTGFMTGPSVASGVPHVTGVRTEAGGELRADLVVDVSGRRSALPRFLEQADARAPLEDSEDSGLVYYGRHFRSADGAVPQMRGPILANVGTLSTLTLPADNGTWGLGILAAGTDKEMRALKDTEKWEAVWRSVPVTAHWLDGEPISDGVAVMANLPDRIRTFVIDGTPVATGVVAVADSWACTNPAVGRGISIGTLHALALRDTLRATGLDDPIALAEAFHDVTTSEVEPWYRATVELDRGRLTEMVALRETGEYGTDDPAHAIAAAVQRGAWRDPDLLRCFLEIATMLAMPDEILARPGMFDKVLEHTDDADPFEMPTREDLLTLVG